MDRRHGDHHLRLDVNHRRAHSHVEGMQSRATQIATSLLSDLTPALSHLLAYEYQTEHVDRPYWGTPLLQPVGAVGRIDRSTRFKKFAGPFTTNSAFNLPLLIEIGRASCRERV